MNFISLFGRTKLPMVMMTVMSLRISSTFWPISMLMTSYLLSLIVVPFIPSIPSVGQLKCEMPPDHFNSTEDWGSR